MHINDLNFDNAKIIGEPKWFKGWPGDDYEMWWILVHVYIDDQPQKFPKDERTID
jgi:hypothetical protein